VGKVAVSIERPKAKSVSVSVGLRPLTRGSAPGSCWVLRPRPPL